MTGIGSMIGSGWLFSAWKTAKLAGPAAILVWPLGVLIIVLLALTYAELGSRYPSRGGMVHYAQLSHGSFAGFISGWAGWIAIVSITPIEAIASVQYLHSWSWRWAQALYNSQSLQLTSWGMALALALIIVYVLFNYWSIHFFMRFNIVLTVFKVIIPLITCAALFYAAFHHHHFHLADKTFMPYGIHSIFTAVATGGLVFAFLGFQSPVNLSGEAKNPKVNVPLAIFLSIAAVFLLYLLLQVVFVGMMTPKDLVHGWAQLDFSSPFIHLALLLNLQWLVTVIYIGAVISPSGSGMIFMATSSRMLFAMSKNGHAPAAFARLHPVYHVPRAALLTNVIVACLFLFIFRGWSSLVSVVSVAILIAFATGPVSALCLRNRDNMREGWHIKGLSIIAPLAFIGISLALYWARWPLTGQVILIVLAGLIF